MSTEQQTVCANHCGHGPDWMKYDEDFEQVRCSYPVGHACNYCGNIPCGHVCSGEREVKSNDNG